MTGGWGVGQQDLWHVSAPPFVLPSCACPLGCTLAQQGWQRRRALGGLGPPHSGANWRAHLCSRSSVQGADVPSSGSLPEAKLLDLDFPGVPDLPVSASALCPAETHGWQGLGFTIRDLRAQRSVGLGAASPLWSLPCCPGASSPFVAPQVLGPPLCVLGPGAIVDVLQYSQRDLDAAVRRGRAREGGARSTSHPGAAAGTGGCALGRAIGGVTRLTGAPRLSPLAAVSHPRLVAPRCCPAPRWPQGQWDPGAHLPSRGA